MGQRIISAQMTLDGVIDNVDQWFSADDEHNAVSDAQLRSADALLLGRLTYEGLARVWPTMTDEHGFADRVNTMPKYVASRSLSGPLAWNAQLLRQDVPEHVAELKSSLNLLMYGCGPFAAALGRAGLVDEVRLGVHPIAFGAGERIFGAARPVQLELVESVPVGSAVELRYRVP
jgi:dihydrofolate reductase